MTTRTAIREAIKQGIAGYFTASFDYRAPQLLDEELPAACVYFEDGDTDQDFDETDLTVGRLVVEITARSNTNIDAALDTLGNQVHSTIKADDTLGGIIEGMRRIGFLYDRDPESNLGGLILIYQLHYFDED